MFNIIYIYIYVQKFEKKETSRHLTMYPKHKIIQPVSMLVLTIYMIACQRETDCILTISKTENNMYLETLTGVTHILVNISSISLHYVLKSLMVSLAGLIDKINVCRNALYFLK